MLWAADGGPACFHARGATLVSMISRVHVLAASALGAVTPGCADSGVVELNWVFVDREGQPFYPGGQFALNRYEDSCNLRGFLGGATVHYDLRLELEVCDPTCVGGCDDAACLVMEPHRFSCATARASDFDVPARSEPYQFQTRAIIEPTEGAACTDLPPTCVAVPGPRKRVVKPGLVTDLQVYQVGVNIDGGVRPSADAAHLNLEDCGCESAP